MRGRRLLVMLASAIVVSQSLCAQGSKPCAETVGKTKKTFCDTVDLGWADAKTPFGPSGYVVWIYSKQVEGVQQNFRKHRIWFVKETRPFLLYPESFVLYVQPHPFTTFPATSKSDLDLLSNTELYSSKIAKYLAPARLSVFCHCDNGVRELRVGKVREGVEMFSELRAPERWYEVTVESELPIPLSSKLEIVVYGTDGNEITRFAARP